MTAAAGTEGTTTRARRAAALPPEERRQAVIDATLPLVLEHGLAVSTRQIADAAGVAEGTIFRVFPDKETLIQAVVDQALDPGPLEARLAAIDLDLPLEERLLEAARILHDRTTSVWRLLSAIGFAPPPGAGPQRSKPMVELTPLVALFEPDRDHLRYDPASTARRFRALAIAGGHPMLMAGQPLTPEDIVSMFLDGVRRPDGSPAHPPTP